MSRTRAHRHKAASSTFGVSTWTSISITIAALISGLLLSLNAHEISWPYLVFFLAGAVLATIVVEVRGIFLTVASIPLFFGLFTVLTGWLVARGNSSGTIAQFSKPMILSALFPLAQHFPYVAGATLVCAVIGFLRYRRGVGKAKLSARRFDSERAERARAEKQNRTTTTRVRELSSRTRRSGNRTGSGITVDELMKTADRHQERNRPQRTHGSRGTSVPPRREPGESVKDMPRIDLERSTREASKSKHELRKANESSIEPKNRPSKKRSSLGDDLYS